MYPTTLNGKYRLLVGTRFNLTMKFFGSIFERKKLFFVKAQLGLLEDSGRTLRQNLSLNARENWDRNDQSIHMKDTLILEPQSQAMNVQLHHPLGGEPRAEINPCSYTRSRNHLMEEGEVQVALDLGDSRFPTFGGFLVGSSYFDHFNDVWSDSRFYKTSLEN